MICCQPNAVFYIIFRKQKTLSASSPLHSIMFRKFAEQYPATESGENQRKYTEYIITLKLFFVNQSVTKMAFIYQKIINDKSIPSPSLLT